MRMAEVAEPVIDNAALARVLVAQHLVIALDGRASHAHRDSLWEQMDALLAKDGSDAVVSTIAFGLRQTHDIPNTVLHTLSHKADASAAILFEEAEGISDVQWESLITAAPAHVEGHLKRCRNKGAVSEETLLPQSSASLGPSYKELKAALTELHESNRLSNRLLVDIVSIWGIPAVVGTLALRSGHNERWVIATMRDDDRRDALFASCDFDADVVSRVRQTLRTKPDRTKRISKR